MRDNSFAIRRHSVNTNPSHGQYLAISKRRFGPPQFGCPVLCVRKFGGIQNFDDLSSAGRVANSLGARSRDEAVRRGKKFWFTIVPSNEASAALDYYSDATV